MVTDDFSEVFDGLTDTPTEVSKTTETEVVKETPINNEVEKEVETEVETPEAETDGEEKPAEEIETPAAEKRNWRERYQETDDFKAKLRKQDEAVYAAKLKKIEDVENTPAFQIISKALDEGKDPMEAIRAVAVDNISNLTPKDLFMKDLEKYKDSLTEDEFAEEVEKFEGKSKLEQIKATESIKAELTNAREAELAKFKPVAKETKLNPELQEKVTKFDTELENMLSNLDGKTINGVTFTPAVLNKIEETLAHGHISPDMYIDENGNFDAGEAIELAVLKHYRAAFINGLKGEYKSLGMKEALKQKHNVSSGKVKNTGMPDPTGNAAKRKADLDFMFPKQ